MTNPPAPPVREPLPAPHVPQNHAEELEVEVFSTDEEIEKLRQKMERAWELGQEKLSKLARRRAALVKSLTREREQGAGWKPMVRQGVDRETGQPRKIDVATGEVLE